MGQGSEKKGLHPAIVVATIAVILTTLSLLPGRAASVMLYGSGGAVDYAPQVRIISPDDETVDLTGRNALVLRWSRLEGDSMERRYYDVRVYRGRETLENTLIFSAQTPPDADTVRVPSSLFDNGRTYTWTIRQRYYGLAQSRRAYAVFTVFKR